MKKKTFLSVLFTLILFTFNGYAQSAKNRGLISMGGAELGLKSGLFYEQRLSPSFSLLASAGYAVGTGITFHSGFSYTGVRPAVSVAPRWYFNVPENNSLNNAPYITFEVLCSTESGALFVPKEIQRREKWDVSTILAAGYKHSLSEKIMLKGQAGISMGFSKLYEKQGVFDSKDWKGKNELVFDLGILYKF